MAIAFIAIFLITFTVNRQYIARNTDLVSVAVANTKIPAYSRLNQTDISMRKFPKSAVPKDAVLDPTPYTKDEVYYTGDIGFSQGDIIRAGKLTTSDMEPATKLARLKDDKKMLLAIDTNLVKSCANLVTPGSRVNAVVFIKGEGSSGFMGDSEENKDKTISPAEDPYLANLLVVDKKNADASPPPETGREAIPAVITIMLDEDNLEAAKALVEYNEKGSIYLLPVGFESDFYLAP